MKNLIALALIAMPLLSTPFSAFADGRDRGRDRDRPGHDHGRDHDHRHRDDSCEFPSSSDSDADTSLGMTTVGLPFLVTTTLLCAAADDSETNRAMIEKEAALLIEEDRVFNPSFLAKYASDQGESDLKVVARDVLQNGVR